VQGRLAGPQPVQNDIDESLCRLGVTAPHDLRFDQDRLDVGHGRDGRAATLRAATEELTGVRDSRYPNMAG
jgi:hypothetical protein